MQSAHTLTREHPPFTPNRFKPISGFARCRHDIAVKGTRNRIIAAKMDASLKFFYMLYASAIATTYDLMN